MLFDETEKEEIKGFKKRLSLLSVLVLLLLGVLLTRLWQLQIMQGEKYRTLSENNRVRVLPARTPRGYIKDSRRELLVESRPVFKLYLMPEEVPDVESLLAQIEPNISVDMEGVRRRLASANKFKPVLVKDDLSRDELAYLEEQRPELQGTFIEAEPVRYYRYGPLAAHLMGYIGEVSEEELKSAARDTYMPGDYLGKSGLERAYDHELKGRKGGKFVEVDALGREVRSLGNVEPIMGNTIILTLDLELQLLAEGLLGNERGAIVALDPTNGQILAYASKPSFDPNLFSNGIGRGEWAELIRDRAHPLQDRVIYGQYPPGSVFKIITAVAALEEKVIDTNTTFYCPGYYYFGGRIFRDWKKEGHGMVSLHRGLVESSDVYFYQVGLRVGVDNIYKYARGFGLGKPIGTVLGSDKSGLIPSTSWKRAALNEPWYQGETLSVAIGQGYVLVTPMQLAVMISAVANGGTLYLPQFVKQIEDLEGRTIKAFRPQVMGSVPASPDTLDIIKKGLWGVVNEPNGTGHRARIPWTDVAGKTGTAQVVGLNKRWYGDSIKESLDHAWFVSFAPVKDPRIAVVVFVENAGRGGGSYAYIAKNLIETYLTRQRDMGLNGADTRHP